MISGAVLALFYALFAMIGAVGGIAFVIAAGSGK